MTIILMGVSGCGKTSVGRMLASRHGLVFLDADDHHPPANVAKMSRGEPLTDADRWPWLDALNGLLKQHADEGQAVVLACSALRRAYRARLAAGLSERVRWVYLRADESVIAARLSERKGHFMPVSLLRSQFATLEEPVELPGVLVVEVDRPIEKVAAEVERGMGFETRDQEA